MVSSLTAAGEPSLDFSFFGSALFMLEVVLESLCPRKTRLRRDQLINRLPFAFERAKLTAAPSVVGAPEGGSIPPWGRWISNLLLQFDNDLTRSVLSEGSRSCSARSLRNIFRNSFSRRSKAISCFCAASRKRLRGVAANCVSPFITHPTICPRSHPSYPAKGTADRFGSAKLQNYDVPDQASRKRARHGVSSGCRAITIGYRHSIKSYSSSQRSVYAERSR
jgi:hypothetical protein